MIKCHRKNVDTDKNKKIRRWYVTCLMPFLFRLSFVSKTFNDHFDISYWLDCNIFFATKNCMNCILIIETTTSIHCKQIVLCNLIFWHLDKIKHAVFLRHQQDICVSIVIIINVLTRLFIKPVSRPLLKTMSSYNDTSDKSDCF